MAKTEISLEQFEDWKKASDRLEEMKLDLQTLEDKTAEILHKIIHAENYGKNDSLTVEAMALLGGGKESVPDTGSLRTELGKINHDKLVLTRAIEIQKRAVEKLRHKRSAELCKGLTPKYKGLVRDVARAAVNLAKMMQKERQFRDNLFQADIAFTCSGNGSLDTSLDYAAIRFSSQLWRISSGDVKAFFSTRHSLL